MKKIFIVIVKKYQKLISPLLGSTCRFRPTCSDYCIEAIEKHGVVKGCLRTCTRILRCHPFCKGGHDPVK